jgi:3-dehydroquinate synthetase
VREGRAVNADGTAVRSPALGGLGSIPVRSATEVEFSLRFTSSLRGLDGGTLLGPQPRARSALLVTGARPSEAEDALWERLRRLRDEADLERVSLLRLEGPDGPAAVHTVLEASVRAGLARRDALVTAGGPAVAAATLLAAGMLRRHTDAVRVVTDFRALAEVLGRGVCAPVDGAPVALPLRRAAAVVDLERLSRPGPFGPDEEAGAEWLATRIGRKGPAVPPDPVARHSLLESVRIHWPSVLPRAAGSGEWTAPDEPDAAAGEAWPERTASARRSLSFPIVLESGALAPGRAKLTRFLRPGTKILAVVDAYGTGAVGDVRRLLDDYRTRGLISEFAVWPERPSRRTKSLARTLAIVEQARRLGLGPQDRIVAVGGGTVMDTAGFAAALYQGMTPYIRVPTTLVGQVDAAVGFKVGVDALGRRNLVGAYHPPVAAVCDPGYLRTLPLAELRCGLSEMVKIAAIRDERLFERIEEGYGHVLAADGPALPELIRGSIEAMVEDLVANPCETELRRLPDFGHEFGHMLETLSRSRLRHGEAVAVGMALSCRIGAELGVLSAVDADRILTLIQRIGLPVYDRCARPEDLRHGVLTDVIPHKDGALHLVVPSAIGSGGYVETPEAWDARLLEKVCRQLSARQEAARPPAWSWRMPRRAR